MATYYISPTGNDSAPGTYADPWAITALSSTTKYTAGNILVLKDGTYIASGSTFVSLNVAGQAGMPVVVICENLHQAVLNCNWVADIGIYIGKNYITIQGLEIKNVRAGGGGAAIFGTNSGCHDIIIRRNLIHHIGSAASLCSDNAYGRPGIFASSSGGSPSYNWTIDSNTIHDIGRVGGSAGVNQWVFNSGNGNDGKHDHPLYLEFHDSIIINNLFYNVDTGPFRGWPVMCYDAGNSANNKNIRVINNTIVGASVNTSYTRGHIYFAGGQTKLNNLIANNISYEPNDALLHDWGSGAVSNGVIRNNICTETLLYNDGNSNVWSYNNNLITYSPGNPLFTDASNYDFSLVGNAPAINAASLTDLPAYDIAENSRPLPVGSNGDIGAYELGDGTPPPPPPTSNEITGLTHMPDGSWSTILDDSGKTWGSYTDMSGNNIRQQFTVSADASRIRVTLKNPANTATTIVDAIWIGKAAGNLIDFAETPTQLKLSGSGAITLPYDNGITLLDVCDLLNPFDHTHTYLFSWYNHDGSVSRMARWTGVSGTTYRYASTNESGVVNVSEANYSANTAHGLLYKIEKFALTYPDTYEADLTTQPVTITEDGVALTEKASIAEVSAKAGSWYWNSNVVYIHPTTGASGSHTYLWQLSKGLVATFPCGEGSGSTIIDIENGLTSTITNGSWTTWKGVNVILLNGSTSNIIVPAATVINNLTEFTYTLWVYPLYFDTTIYPRIFSREGLDESKPFFCCIGDDGYIGAAIYDETKQYVSNGYITSGSFRNRWSFITVTYDNAGDRKLYIYVNGQEINYNRNEAVSGTLHANSNDLYIGSNYNNTRMLQGKITKINIYNNALTAGEIATAYQNEWPVSERLYYGDGIFFVH